MKRLLVAAALLLAACQHSHPFAPRAALAVAPELAPGTLAGVVVSDEGSPLPGVMVTIDGAPPRTVVTDGDGKFLFERLAPGATYHVEAALAGFGTAKREAVLPTASGARMEVAIRAAVSQTITVTAEAPLAWWKTSAASVPEPEPDEVAQYAAFEDHDWKTAAKERVTTFAIDVDRASYANVRRFLRGGALPPRDAVRIEEMVNYFTYDYPQPSADAPFSVTTEVAGCPWNPEHRLLRIGIQGRNLDEWKMAPNHLVFLIDVSGSMGVPNRLPLIQRSLRTLVEQLRAEDRVAIVVYAGAAGLVLPATSGADKSTILSAINALSAGGATAGAAGIELAYAIAEQQFDPRANNRVILATDGDFNVGISDPDALEKLIEQKRAGGIFLSTVGVGDDNFQDARMELLADKGNGNYNYLDSDDEGEKVFRRELTGTLVTIAKDVKVQLEFDPAQVASYRQIGYENRALKNEDFDDDAKDAGELGAGHSVTALYELVPARGARGGAIATIKLRYKQPDGDTSRLLEAVASDDGKSMYEASPDLQFAAAVAEFGMLLRHTRHDGHVTWDDALQLARTARGVDADGTRTEFLTLLETARTMR
ncbi:MAG TPA: von Willebrand factor type A domain-containing protein [Thermoanaerobaculia bacterium]|jgi:Ca-activated chloride channel family protein